MNGKRTRTNPERERGKPTHTKHPTPERSGVGYCSKPSPFFVGVGCRCQRTNPHPVTGLGLVCTFQYTGVIRYKTPKRWAKPNNEKETQYKPVPFTFAFPRVSTFHNNNRLIDEYN